MQMYFSKPSGITIEVNVFRDKVQQNYKVHSLHLLKKNEKTFHSRSKHAESKGCNVTDHQRAQL